MSTNQIDNIYKGVITAIITPYNQNKDGTLGIDFESFDNLVKTQINAGIDGLVIAGSTGEGTCLNDDEMIGLLKRAKDIRSEYKSQNDNNRTAIICGLANASTRESARILELINQVEIEGVMLTTPYYVKPSPEGLYKHFSYLANLTDLQVILYSNKSRTGVEIDIQTIVDLSKIPNIVALKDAETDITRPLKTFKYTSRAGFHYDWDDSFENKDNKERDKREILPSHFNILSGNDENYLAFHIHGASGLVSVLSNIMPKTIKNLHSYLASGQYDNARNLQCALFDIYDAVYSSVNPTGIKCATNLLGLSKEYVALPLVTAKIDTVKKIEKILPKIIKIEASFK